MNFINPMIQMKASEIRGIIKSLRNNLIYTRLLEQLPLPTKSLLIDPPIVTTWIDVHHFDAIWGGIMEIGGEAMVRRISRESIQIGVLPIIMPIIYSTVRMFGATPQTLLSKIGFILGSSTKGVEYDYISDGPSKGRVLMHCPTGVRMSYPSLVSTCGSFENVFEICKVQGTVHPLPDTSDGHQLSLAWNP